MNKIKEVENMDVKMLHKDEIKSEIESKLKSGWCIIQGDMKMISEIEEKIYTPDTDKNKDFEILGFNPCVVFGKKTKELKDMLNNPFDFNEVLVLTFQRINDNQVKTVLTGAKKTSAIAEIAEDLTRQLTHENEYRTK